MRIAVIDVLPVGGAKRVVFEQLKGLAKNHDLLHCTSDEDFGFDFESIKNVTRKRFSLLKSMHSNDWVPYDVKLFSTLLPLHWAMAKEVEKFKADVVLAHPDRYTQAPFLLSLIEETPVVYFAEEWYRLIYEDAYRLSLKQSLPSLAREWVHRRILQVIDRVNVKQADTVITTSEFNKRNLMQAYSVDAQVLPLGVDTEIFRPLEEEVRRDYFLFIGEKDEVHGYPLLETAIKQSQWPFNVKVVSFRDGHFDLTESALVKAYQRAAAVICLDKNEPFGLVPLEAMACETAVIAVNEGGYAETVVDGETGILIERDVESLVQAMKTIATDSPLRKKFQVHGKQRVEKLFTWKRHSKQLEEVLNETAKKD